MDICLIGALTRCRDKAMMPFLIVDIGVRATELLSIKLEEINLILGEVLIRRGKSRKPHCVYIGSKTRKAVRVYLRLRHDSVSFFG